MPRTICVDFDGTIVDHQYPDIGQPVPGAFFYLKKYQQIGAKLILLTMRSDERQQAGNVLQQAVQFCRQNGLEFYAVNNNPDQDSWTTSRKVYGHIYIDDAAACCPLRQNPRSGGRPYVDWDIVGPAVLQILEAHVK